MSEKIVEIILNCINTIKAGMYVLPVEDRKYITKRLKKYVEYLEQDS